jgi:hypothetical protein
MDALFGILANVGKIFLFMPAGGTGATLRPGFRKKQE